MLNRQWCRVVKAVVTHLAMWDYNFVLNVATYSTSSLYYHQWCVVNTSMVPTAIGTIKANMW